MAPLKWFGLLVALLPTPFLMAQKGYQDVVYLKNGSVVRGMVIEQVPGVSIKIQTGDKSVFVFQMDEVEKITKEQPAAAAKAEADLSPGYQGMVGAGYAIGFGAYGSDRAKLEIVNGYRFGPHAVAGIGIGLHFFSVGDTASNTFLPVFLEGRVNVLDRDVSPYVAGRIGVAYNASQDLKTMGLLAEAGLGAVFRLGGRKLLHVGAGIDMQEITFDEGVYESYELFIVERKVNSSAVSLNVGLSF